MPAVRSKNLRSGDIAEQLGLLLLQNLALVAPVPRTEDVGVDAVVTLLENFDSYRLIAADSFFVQIKSESVKEITYEKEQVKWLFDLELPFFIASVNKTTSSLELYCCHRLSDAFVMNKKREKIIIKFNAEDNWDYFVDKNNEDVHVGPPVLSWSISNISADSDFRDRFNLICKLHIQSAARTLRTRRVGWVENISWKTNMPPETFAFKSACSSPPGEMIEEVAELMMPYFSMLLDECMRAKDATWPNDLLSLLQKNIMVIQALKNSEKS